MYTICYYRNDTENTYTTNDFRTACIVAFNEVCYLGCDVAHITNSETGEIIRTYTKDWTSPFFITKDFSDLNRWTRNRSKLHRIKVLKKK